MKKKTGLILGGVFLFSFVLALGVVMATVDTQTASATVTVNELVSITLTDAGGGGVIFGSSDPGINDIGDADQTSVIPAIRVTNDAVSNVNVNVDVKGTDFTGTPSGSMVAGQATYDDENLPSEGSETGKAETTLANAYPGTPYYSSIAPGNDADFWFFLDIPSGQAAASYSSTLTFQGSS